MEILLGEAEVFDIVDDLLQPGGDGKAVAVWIVAVKGVEDHSFIGVLGIKITLHHGQFIEIRQQRQVAFTHNTFSLCTIPYRCRHYSNKGRKTQIFC